jgi:hypothetical protein
MTHPYRFELRISTGSAVSIIAANRCGQIKMPNDWKETVRRLIDILGYWENESAELPETKQMLITMMESI